MIAPSNVGRRCRWREDGSGTIVGTTIGRGGWSVYIVEWDDGCPPWWGTRVSVAHGPTFIIEGYPSVTDEDDS